MTCARTCKTCPDCETKLWDLFSRKTDEGVKVERKMCPECHTIFEKLPHGKWEKQ